MQIFYSVIVFYFVITYLDNIDILNKILLHKTKIFFLILILSTPNFNLNIQKILNFNERLNKYTNLDDSFFLNKKQVMFVSNAKKIVEEYECVQLFTNSAMLLYLLRKPSCSIFYFTITVGSKENQIKFNKLMSNTQIVISDTYKNEFSPSYRLKYINKYIQDNYENIYEEDVWIIKKRLN